MVFSNITTRITVARTVNLLANHKFWMSSHDLRFRDSIAIFYRILSQSSMMKSQYLIAIYPHFSWWNPNFSWYHPHFSQFNPRFSMVNSKSTTFPGPKIGVHGTSHAPRPSPWRPASARRNASPSPARSDSSSRRTSWWPSAAGCRGVTPLEAPVFRWFFLEKKMVGDRCFFWGLFEWCLKSMVIFMSQCSIIDSCW